MREIKLFPYAPALLESIRSIGYTLESAIADLIDNSISAGATDINISFSPYGKPYIAIMDNGCGMDPEELTQAMRHGSRNPLDYRESNDLGRFGLGLKTASLSQCRKFTLISKKNGIISSRCWDLDLIIEREDWILIEMDMETISQFPLFNELSNLENGTLVVWHYLDRLCTGEISIEKALGEKMSKARLHLSLVFHRFLSGEAGFKKLGVIINGNPILPLDPFMESHKATERLHEENILIDEQIIKIKPYILPHMSKISSAELAQYGGEDGFKKQQGFYVYRNYRLITWGTWFRLIRQEELSKLARVRIDIPNSLDHLWTLDIKKSGAYPPEVVRKNLKRIVDRIANGSKRVYKFRGNKQRDNQIIHTWERLEGREGGIYYQINRNHPLLYALDSRLDYESKKILKLLLENLETTFPRDSFYEDMATDKKVELMDDKIKGRLKEIAFQIFKVAEPIEGARARLVEQIHLLDPFCFYPDYTTEIMEEYLNDK